jgi:hypothetical protein
MEAETRVKVGLRGLSRFYDDGMTRWPLEKALPLFAGLYMDSEEVQRALSDLEARGFIKLHKTSDLYLEVLRRPQTE